MYHYIKDLAIKLAEAGYLVDVFFKDWDVRPYYADIKDFDVVKNIRFYNFTTKSTRREIFIRRLERILNKISILLSIPRNYSPEKIIDPNILEWSKEIIGTSRYYCYIGIEKGGLIWAGILSELSSCPLIYYSLELFIEDNPVIDRIYHILDAERKFHKQTIATIIQDSPRAEVLLKSNEVEKTTVLQLPVSSKGKAIREKSGFLHTKLNIDKNKKIILYFGGLDKTRSISQIVESAKYLDEGVVLVLHGFGPKRYIKHLLSIADKSKVIFSFDFVPEDEILNLISSAHIGIALYKTTNANDRLVAFSSSKIAYYTQCGVPIIAFNTESFRKLADSYQCVELINTFNEIPHKVKIILDNYNSYREESFSAYQRFYNLDDNFSRLIRDLELTVNNSLSTNDAHRASQFK